MVMNVRERPSLSPPDDYPAKFSPSMAIIPEIEGEKTFDLILKH